MRRVNFGTHTAQVRGDAGPDALIRAEKDEQTYRQRIRGSLLSLALAIPLMASMFIHHP